MDPTGYLDLSSPNLVSVSRMRRSQPDQSILPEPSIPRFSLFFSSWSEISLYLKNRSRSGNAYVFGGGRVVVGPKWFPFAVSMSILIVTCVATFFSTTAPLIVNPPTTLSFILSIVVTTVFPVVIVLALLTGLCNPGIVPRNERDPANDSLVDPKSIDSTTGFLVPRYLLLNGVCVRQKYCRTCKIYRPPRSNHCSVCDNCVLKFDHHCAALGTCVGLGNYRWFILLIAGLAILCPAIVYLNLSQLSRDYSADQPVVSYLCDRAEVVVILILAVLGTLGFFILFFYHYFITAHNLTTNEHLKKYYKVNPFDYGKWVNFVHCLVHPDDLLPNSDQPFSMDASYKELGSTNSECVSDFYDY